MPLTVSAGSPYPLGATWDGEGVNFALFAEHATRVTVCLFDQVRGREIARFDLPEVTRHVWHGYIGGLRPGQLYGYRVAGPYNPANGERFNHAKLLIDPYARAIAGEVDWDQPVFGYRLGHPRGDLSRDDRNSARGMPKSVVVDGGFNWRGDRPPNTPWNETVIYEVHVKGFTKCHPEVPENLRGTYAGLATEPAISYLKELGVTAVELLPVHHFVTDKFLLDRGLTNYWGYNSIGFFAPSARYSSSGDRGGQVAEFKTMVRALHAAGIEVILDVVYNHTGEGNHLGPTLAFRGIDNPAYYALVPNDRRYYLDYTGTGNSLNVGHAATLKLIADSLRYWVEEMHVDGFRFDLATTLARDPGYDRGAAFFDIVYQDPVLSRVKLIAEPWDVGEYGYQVGNFPVIWAEWNDKYRDTVRRFWKGDGGQVAELASRLSGSSDLYALGGRGPWASINFVTAHDGFTLRDLVSYNAKHNEANGEENRDGINENNSWNCGAEGPTEDPAIEALRARQQRNFLATLLFSQGVPMLLGGDELGRSQGGNNNAYCQDNEVSWFDWELGDAQRALLEFTRRLIRLRREHPTLRYPKYFLGRRFVPGTVIKDLTWFKYDGTEMTDQEWGDGEARSLGMLLTGDAIDLRDRRGRPVPSDTLMLLLNAHHEPIPFVLPPITIESPGWEVLVDTFRADPAILPGDPDQTVYQAGDEYPLEGRSLVLLRVIRRR